MFFTTSGAWWAFKIKFSLCQSWVKHSRKVYFLAFLHAFSCCHVFVGAMLFVVVIRRNLILFVCHFVPASKEAEVLLDYYKHLQHFYCMLCATKTKNSLSAPLFSRLRCRNCHLKYLPCLRGCPACWKGHHPTHYFFRPW